MRFRPSPRRCPWVRRRAGDGGRCVPGPATARPPISDSAAARAEGTRLFRAKNFAAACPKFEKAAQLAPRSRAARGSGALQTAPRRHRLCGEGQSAGDRPRIDREGPHRFAIRPQPASRLFQPPSDSRRSFATSRGGTRHLRRAEPRRRVAQEAILLHRLVDRRRELDDAKLHARQHRGLCRSGALRRGRHRLYTHEHAAPDLDELTRPFQPTPEVVEDEESVTYFESYSDEVNEWRCDEKPWSCDRSTPRGRGQKCLASRPRPPSPEACRIDACDRAEHRPWPAVIKERKVAADKRSARLPRERAGERIGIWLPDRLRQRLHWPRRPDLLRPRSPQGERADARRGVSVPTAAAP